MCLFTFMISSLDSSYLYSVEIPNVVLNFKLLLGGAQAGIV